MGKNLKGKECGKPVRAVDDINFLTVEEQEKSDTLSKVLTYIDLSTGQEDSLVMADPVFINYRTGEPTKNSSYNTHLYKLCDEAGIKH